MNGPTTITERFKESERKQCLKSVIFDQKKKKKETEKKKYKSMLG